MSAKPTEMSIRIRRVIRLSTATTLLFIVALLSPAASGAQSSGARFIYEVCDPALPGGSPPTLYFHSEKAYAPVQSCASPGGYVGVTQTGPVTEGPAWIETGIAGTPKGWVESATVTAFASNLQPGAGNSYAVQNGWPPDNTGETARTFIVRTEEGPPCPAICLLPEDYGEGWGFDVALTCSGSCEAGGVVGVRYIAATEVDPNPPKVGKLEGSLLNGGVLRGHQTLTASASDVGGGLTAVDVVVNGTVAPGAVPGSCETAQVRNPSYQGVVAYSPTPCPKTLSGTWNLNTAALPFHEGVNSVQVCASDFATIGQPNTGCSAPVTVTVNNSCTESAVTGGQNLSAALQGASGEEIVLPFEHVAVVTGNLSNASGEPISGATICLQSAIQESGSAESPIATATTDASGNFSYQVPPGPNRRLLVGYRHDSFQTVRMLTVNSHAKPTLALSKGHVGHGGKVTITGSVPGPSAAGRVVVLQASSLHGKRWLTFRKATTGASGGYRAIYRFGATTGTTTYRIRAVVPRQAGYAYESGHSKPKRIKVGGKRVGR